MEVPDRLYLDTNIVERYFKAAVLARKRKKKFKLPFIFLLLKELDIQLFTSTFVLAEVFEHLWKHYHVKPDKISNLTQNFFAEVKVSLIQGFSIKANVLRWIRKMRLEAKDVIHLSISMSKNLYLLTNDEDLVNRGPAFYNKIIYDRKFIGAFSSRLQSSHPR